jgi:hypothetical protein
MRVILVLAILVIPATGSAQEIEVTLDPRARALLGSRFTVVEQTLEAEFEQQTQALVGEADLGEFLDLAANAQALVHKSLGNDYASGADGFIVGASIGAAIDPGGRALSVATPEEEGAVPAGAGAQLTLMLGYNFFDLGLPELTVFAHGMGAPISFSELEGSFYNFGASAQYRVLAPRGTKWLEWGGLHLTSGIEVSRMRLTVAAADMLDFDTTVGGVRIRGDSEGRLTLVQNAVSIPLEVTTAVTTLYVLSFYAGLGADLNFGAARLGLDVDTTVTAGGESGSGSAEASLVDEGDPDRVMFRLLGGAQANLGPVRLFGHVNFVPKDATLSLAAGAKVVF